MPSRDSQISQVFFGVYDGLEMTMYYNNTGKCRENLESLIDHAYFFSKNSTASNTKTQIRLDPTYSSSSSADDTDQSRSSNEVLEVELGSQLLQTLNMTQLISQQASQTIRYCPVMLYHTGLGLWKHFERFEGQDFTSIAEAFLF